MTSNFSKIFAQLFMIIKSSGFILDVEIMCKSKFEYILWADRSNGRNLFPFLYQPTLIRACWKKDRSLNKRKL